MRFLQGKIHIRSIKQQVIMKEINSLRETWFSFGSVGERRG